jgi:ribosomal protein S15P/S13E
MTAEEVAEQIMKFARKGLTPSQIGVILRDSHGVAQVRGITGTKILRILKSNGLAPSIPEDLYHLIKKAVSIRKHLERNRKDMDAKFRSVSCLRGVDVPQIQRQTDSYRVENTSPGPLLQGQATGRSKTRAFPASLTSTQVAPTFRYDAQMASTIVS